MSTRALFEFKDQFDSAYTYQHYDGYPEEVLPALKAFFEEIKRQASKTTKFNDNSLLAARWIVFCAHRMVEEDQQSEYTKSGGYLDFTGLRVVQNASIGVQYRYLIDCTTMKDGVPQVTFTGGLEE